MSFQDTNTLDQIHKLIDILYLVYLITLMYLTMFLIKVLNY